MPTHSPTHPHLDRRCAPTPGPWRRQHRHLQPPSPHSPLTLPQEGGAASRTKPEDLARFGCLATRSRRLERRAIWRRRSGQNCSRWSCWICASSMLVTRWPAVRRSLCQRVCEGCLRSSPRRWLCRGTVVLCQSCPRTRCCCIGRGAQRLRGIAFLPAAMRRAPRPPCCSRTNRISMHWALMSADVHGFRTSMGILECAHESLRCAPLGCDTQTQIHTNTPTDEQLTEAPYRMCSLTMECVLLQ